MAHIKRRPVLHNLNACWRPAAGSDSSKDGVPLKQAEGGKTSGWTRLRNLSPSVATTSWDELGDTGSPTGEITQARLPSFPSIITRDYPRSLLISQGITLVPF